MAIQIMESTGYGLRLFEPVETIEELGFATVSEEFKKEFLEDWKWAYEQEQGESCNGGINTLCVLDDIRKEIEEGSLPTSFTLEEAEKYVIQKMAEDAKEDCRKALVEGTVEKILKIVKEKGNVTEKELTLLIGDVSLQTKQMYAK